MTTKKAEPARDLAEFDGMKKTQNEGIDVPIKGPDGSDLGFSIRIAGPDSDLQKKAQETLANERLLSEDTTPMDAAALNQARVRGLAMSTISWTDFQMDGGIYAFSQDAALRLYLRHPFIREQVEARAGKRAAFLKASSADASSPSSAGSE